VDNADAIDTPVAWDRQGRGETALPNARSSEWRSYRVSGAAIALCTLVVSGLVPAHAGIDRDTLAVWLLNEGEGTTVHDASGKGHDGTFEGSLSWTEAAFGGGLVFPGDGIGYVIVDSTDDLVLEELTVEPWVKVEESTAKWQGISWKQQAGCANRNYGIWAQADQSVLHARIGFGGGCDFQADGTTVITDNQWRHLAFTYDGVVGRLHVAPSRRSSRTRVRRVRVGIPSP
jgi:hypothetical protein